MARILLIEPDVVLARQYQEALAAYDMTWARDAQAAINTADTQPPDLVVMELLLAGHSGIEFLYEFRSYADWKHVPIVIMSRLNRADIPVHGAALEQLGVRAYLYKPDTSLAALKRKADGLLTKEASAAS